MKELPKIPRGVEVAIVPPAPRTAERARYDDKRRQFMESLEDWHDELKKDFHDLEVAAEQSRGNLVAFGAFKTKLAEMRIRLLTSTRAMAGDVAPVTARPVDLSRYSARTQQAIQEALSLAAAEDLEAGRDVMGWAG